MQMAHVTRFGFTDRHELFVSQIIARDIQKNQTKWCRNVNELGWRSLFRILFCGQQIDGERNEM